ncbi:MAG: BlaI/MecI/CopY family transcriptional regulator [candidate division Zixibacteria bacterium]|nr:BlaI/MecI/CopY family transcriptional regulator [candidate division Zixibacteria bacterium]
MSGPFQFHPEASGTAVFLGPTASRIMEILWRHDDLTVKEAMFYLGSDSSLAYTTVMTILNRLTDRGLLARHKSGRVYRYRPTVTRDDFLAERVATVTSCLSRNFPHRD